METVRPAPEAAWVQFARSGTRAARFGVELDGVAGLEQFDLPGGAGDRLGAQVDLEVALGEQAGSVCALSPRFGEHDSARGKDLIDTGTVDVGAVDMQLDETKSLPLDVLGDGHGAQLLGLIRRGHGAGDDGRELQVTRDVLLVAVEALRAALAPVTHLAVVHGDAPVGCDALPDASPAVRRDLQVLCAYLPEGLDVRAQWLGHDVVQVTVPPSVAARRPAAQRPRRPSPFCFRVAPCRCRVPP